MTSNAAMRRWVETRLASLSDDLSRRATVVLPSPWIAHQIRRALCESGHPGLLAGVRFLGADELAHEVLIRADILPASVRAALRPVALRLLFAGEATRDLGLAYFRSEELAARPGYAEAIAATIDDLEAADVGPGDLCAAAKAWPRAHGGPTALGADRCRDLAILWQATDGDLGVPAAGVPSSIVAHAASVLEHDATLAAPLGRIFALLPPRPPPVVLRLLAALGATDVAIAAGRPLRPLGDANVAAAAQSLDVTVRRPSAPRPPDDSERALVDAFLFAAPEVLADPARPRSRGADGTVALEQYPGMQDEIGAAVRWVVEETTRHRTPLEEIAIVVGTSAVVPHLVAALERGDKGPAADRLGEIDCAPESLPTFVAGGLPLVHTPAGHLLSSVLRALRSDLEAEHTIPLLSKLRLVRPDGAPLSLSEADAQALTVQCGIVGGRFADARAAEHWPRRLRARAAQLGRQLDAGTASDPTDAIDVDAHAEDDREKAKWALRRPAAERLCRAITAVLPAIEALAALSATIDAHEPLATIVDEVVAFHRAWCLVPPGSLDAATALLEDVAPLRAHALGSRLVGHAALDHLIARLGALGVPHGRFGEPRIFVGAPVDVLGLSFRALRVLGAAEGALPRGPHEDPILPDTERAVLTAVLGGARAGGHRLIPTSAARVLEDTHEVFFAVTAPTERLAISAPRRWIDGTDRELAALILEAAVAIARPDRSGKTVAIPSLAELRHDYLGPAAAARRQVDSDHPAVTGAILGAVAAATGPGEPRRVPPAWLAGDTAATYLLPRLRTMTAARDGMALTLADGAIGLRLGAARTALPVPGVDATRAISASGLVMLLGCPHRFLLEAVLALAPPAEPPSVRTIAQPYYGTLVHRAMERFLGTHGPGFCRQDATLAEWERVAGEITDHCFSAFLDEYPLLGAAAREAERDRLRRDVQALLRADWEQHLPLEHVGVEIPFGFPPVAVPLGGDRRLFVRGFIDRIDRRGRAVVVRDIKTGRARSRRLDPLAPTLDLQLALYAIVAPSVLGDAGGRVGLAAYAYADAGGESERAYATTADIDALLTAGRRWLDVAERLLVARSFPHAVDPEACRYCAFRPVCGEGAVAASRESLAALDPDRPERPFAMLHAVGADG